MTEAEWLATTSPDAMAGFLYRRLTPWYLRALDWCGYRYGSRHGRKMLLLFYAYCRCHWRQLCEERQEAAKTVERALHREPVTVDRETEDWLRDSAYGIRSCLYESAHRRTLYWVDAPEAGAAARSEHEQAEREFCDLAREIFGNPFRPASVDPSLLEWDDGGIAKLAQMIYDEQAFDRLPDLAHTLTQAGCDNAAILEHCRSPGPHVRGCWVVDLILGKT